MDTLIPQIRWVVIFPFMGMGSTEFCAQSHALAAILDPVSVVQPEEQTMRVVNASGLFSRGSPGLTFPLCGTAGHQLLNIGRMSYFVFFHLNLIRRKVHLVYFVLPEEKGCSRVSFFGASPLWRHRWGLYGQDLHLFSFLQQQQGGVEQGPHNWMLVGDGKGAGPCNCKRKMEVT